MTDFHQRWQTLAREARRHPGALFEPPPLGFATRVIARFQETPAEAWEDILSAFGLRAVLATTLLFLLSAGFAFSGWYESRMEPPALVVLPVTSELSWP